MSYRISFDATPKRNPFPGTFIALEGIDGSGKTSQIEPLTRYFQEKGKEVLVTRSPRKTEGVLATLNQSILQGSLTIPKPAFQYLFTADYIMQMEDTILPALQKGSVVITDRFHCWSSLAYGLWEISDTYDLSMAQSMLISSGLLSKSYQLVVPDMTFYFAVSVNTAMKRIPGKEEAKEVYEKKDILEKVAKGYDWLRKEFPELFTVLDAEASIDEVTKDMIEKIENIAYRGETPKH